MELFIGMLLGTAFYRTVKFLVKGYFNGKV